MSEDVVLQLLNYKRFYELIDKAVPSTTAGIISTLEHYGACKQEDGKWSITNLGAILFARNIDDFPTLASKSVIVRKYTGTNNRNLQMEQIGKLAFYNTKALTSIDLPEGLLEINTSAFAGSGLYEITIDFSKLADYEYIDCIITDEENLGFTYAELDRYIRTGEIEDEAKKELIDRKQLSKEEISSLLDSISFFDDEY